MSGFEDYAGLATTGFDSREPSTPENDFFHSVYISGQNRQNHIGVTEEAGKLQIRGVDYNLPEVNMIITHVKQILVKEEKNPTTNRTSTTCTSFMEGNGPYNGSPSGIQCGKTSADRASNPFCSSCRSQLIVAGILCDVNGKPKVDDQNKPIFGFLRGKGSRYANVSDYLNNMTKLEGLTPIFTPVTPESESFEKSVVNNKRFVTKITVSQTNTSFGNMVNVFNLEKAIQIGDDNVKQILEISKKTFDKFVDKFNWEKGSNASGANYNVQAENQFDAGAPAQTQDAQPSQQPQGTAAPQPQQETGQQTPNKASEVSFDDLSF